MSGSARRPTSTSSNSRYNYYAVVLPTWSAIFLSWSDARVIVDDITLPVCKYKGFNTFADAQRFCLFYSRSNLGLHSRPTSPPAIRPASRPLNILPSSTFITPLQSPIRDQGSSSTSTGELPITLNMGSLSLTVSKKEQYFLISIFIFAEFLPCYFYTCCISSLLFLYLLNFFLIIFILYVTLFHNGQPSFCGWWLFTYT